MRKKTVKTLADTIFWYILYFLPVLVYLFYMLAEPSSGTNVVSFSYIMQTGGFNVLSDNVILVALKDLFGTDGVLPFLSDTTLLEFFAYFVSVYIVHLCVDFLLFIPRLAHKWLKDLTQGD